MGPKKFIGQGVVAMVSQWCRNGVGQHSPDRGAVPANADPDWGGGERDEWVDNDWGEPNWNGLRDPAWQDWHDGDWHKWWRVNKWRNDDRPPWGGGPPPAVHRRGHLPQ